MKYIENQALMKFTLAEISHFDFLEQLGRYTAEIENLLKNEKIDLEELRQESNKFIDSAIEFISNHIIPCADPIVEILNVSTITIFDNFYSSYTIGRDPKFEKEIKRIDKFNRSLKLAIAYLSIVDSLIDKNIERQIKSISEKNDYVLTKLNKLFGDENYSISMLLSLNNIKQRDGEGREIAIDLNRRGYVILSDRYGSSDEVKISIKGASYIERRDNQKSFKNSPTQLDRKIDNIIEHLNKLGYGQEIIFNEIEELRELQHKLSRKSWTQLLKGKLIDLALDKLISIETVTSVYEYLTNNHLRLLK